MIIVKNTFNLCGNEIGGMILHYAVEQARTQSLTAKGLIRQTFAGQLGNGAVDAAFFSARRDRALGFAPLYPPIWTNSPAASFSRPTGRGCAT